MNVGDRITVYHTISEGASATTTDGLLQMMDELGVTVKRRANASATLWEDTFIPLPRIAKIVGPEYNGRGRY